MRLRNVLKALALGSALALSAFSSHAEAQPKKAQAVEKRDAKASKPSSSKKPTQQPVAKSSKSDKASAEAKNRKKATASNGTDKGSSKKADTKSAKAGTSQRPQRTASTQAAGKSGKASTKKGKATTKKPKPPCLQPAVEIARGFQRTETESFSLTYCDGKPAPNAVELLSLLARPHGVAKPKNWPPPPPKESEAKNKSAKAKPKKGKKAKAEVAKATTENELPPGLRLLDEGLVTRLQKVVDHFGKKRVFIVSGYRPKSDKSYHQKAKAIDFRLEGVSNEALVAFCRTLKDTGCGYYPNSSFVHMDVRPPKTGHVYWIDASGPGEKPRYVSSWPPPPEEVPASKPTIAKKGADSDDDTEDESDLPSLMDAFGSDMAAPIDVAPAGELNTL